jgi:D-glycero-alpha-D-manno-heptose-7-phosphate kinase
MQITQTPFRISLVGGGTDLESFYKTHGPGCVVSFTIDRFMYIAVNPKFDGNVRVSYSVTEVVEDASMLLHELARECLHRMGISKGIEVISVADMPGRGTGLGSSSAYTVGLLNALSQYRIYHPGEPYQSIEDVAEEACKIEIERCGKPIGKQDQYAVAYGGLNQFVFHPDGFVSINPIPLTSDVKDEMEKHMLLFWIGRRRSSREILSEQKKITEGAKIDALEAMAQLARILYAELDRGVTENIGRYLHENWEMKKSLVKGISDPQIDNWYRKAREAGAVGGKVAGAGGGGLLLFWAEPEYHIDIKATLGLRHVPFKIEPRGTRLYGDER